MLEHCLLRAKLYEKWDFFECRDLRQRDHDILRRTWLPGCLDL